MAYNYSNTHPAIPRIFRGKMVTSTYFKDCASVQACSCYHIRFSTHSNYMSLCTSSFRDQNTLFDIEYRDNGYVALKAANNKYASAAMNGSLSFGSASVGAKEQFEMVICNKQRLELRCEHGFVGLSTSNKVNCNQSNYTQFQLEASTNPEEKGEYYIKGM